MTYTKEQVEAAIDSVYSFVSCTDLTDKVISELTKPAPEFKVGEVVINNNIPIVWRGDWDSSLYRHLTPEEVPALAFLIEVLKKIRTETAATWVCDEIDTALDDIKALL